MTSSYCIVQYTPDPATGEKLNVGIVSWSADRVACKFTNNWRRLRSVAADDLGYLQEFSDRFSKQVLIFNNEKKSKNSGVDFYETNIKHIGHSWASHVCFTEPRGSIKDETTTVSALSGIFLSIIADDGARRRTRSTAVSLTVKALRSAVNSRLSSQASKDYVIIKPEVTGELENHILDVGLKNGKLISGVHALSFEGQDPVHLDREVESTAYIMNDVRKAVGSVPVSVFVLPPNKITERAYNRAEKIFKAMRIPVIEENGLAKWAAKQADELAIHVE